MGRGEAQSARLTAADLARRIAGREDAPEHFIGNGAKTLPGLGQGHTLVCPLE